MKVQLVVVQGKSEGKTIPLLGPVFKIGRGETCHLRPNSERVSREHAEFTVTARSVEIRDLGSRNGTLVNGKALTQPVSLKDRDLVQVGPLTFAVSILDGPAAAGVPTAAPDVKAASPLGPAAGAPQPWSAAEGAGSSPGLGGGETILIPAFFAADAPRVAPLPRDDDADDDEYERHPVVEGDTVLDIPAEPPPPPNPAPVSGKRSKAEAGGERSSDAASEILRKMMERRPLPK